MWLLKAFLQKAQLSDVKWGRNHSAHPARVLGVSDIVAPGSVTNEPHVLLLCTNFMLEFKQGEKGSH